MRYTYWNNKGGTGKTSLCFHCLVRYAEANPNKKVLAIDVCPQANLSELLLGGLINSGSKNLNSLQEKKTIYWWVFPRKNGHTICLFVIFIS